MLLQVEASQGVVFNTENYKEKSPVSSFYAVWFETDQSDFMVIQVTIQIIRVSTDSIP